MTGAKFRSDHDATQGRDPDLGLEWASAKTIMRLLGAPPGVKTWHCPCHDDDDPSFSADIGREPGTTIVACGAGCSSAELLAYFRKRGYRLGPMKEPLKLKRVKLPVTVENSVALKACTLSERRMYDLIASGQNPTYNDFMAVGVRRESIPGGIRALQVLGLIGVKRSPRTRGCTQYGQNQYWKEDGWLRLQPSGSSSAAMKSAVNAAKAVAKAGRKSDQDITPPFDRETRNRSF